MDVPYWTDDGGEGLLCHSVTLPVCAPPFCTCPVINELCGAIQAQNDRKNTNLFLDKHFGGTIIADEALPENNGQPVPSAGHWTAGLGKALSYGSGGVNVNSYKQGDRSR